MAFKAVFLVDADGAAAFRAGPSLLFGFNKYSYAGFLNVFKVFKHAHVVLCPVPLVQVYQSVTGIFFAVKTILCLAGFVIRAGF